MYDVADIRARLKPKRQALQEKKMREKGLIATKKEVAPGGRARSASELSPFYRGETSHLPGEVTNPDEQLYQFVA